MAETFSPPVTRILSDAIATMEKAGHRNLTPAHVVAAILPHKDMVGLIGFATWLDPKVVGERITALAERANTAPLSDEKVNFDPDISAAAGTADLISAEEQRATAPLDVLAVLLYLDQQKSRVLAKTMGLSWALENAYRPYVDDPPRMSPTTKAAFERALARAREGGRAATLVDLTLALLDEESATRALRVCNVDIEVCRETLRRLSDSAQVGDPFEIGAPSADVQAVLGRAIVGGVETDGHDLLTALLELYPESQEARILGVDRDTYWNTYTTELSGAQTAQHLQHMAEVDEARAGATRISRKDRWSIGTLLLLPTALVVLHNVQDLLGLSDVLGRIIRGWRILTHGLWDSLLGWLGQWIHISLSTFQLDLLTLCSLLFSAGLLGATLSFRQRVRDFVELPWWIWFLYFTLVVAMGWPAIEVRVPVFNLVAELIGWTLVAVFFWPLIWAGWFRRPKATPAPNMDAPTLTYAGQLIAYFFQPSFMRGTTFFFALMLPLSMIIEQPTQGFAFTNSALFLLAIGASALTLFFNWQFIPRLMALAIGIWLFDQGLSFIQWDATAIDTFLTRLGVPP